MRTEPKTKSKDIREFIDDRIANYKYKIALPGRKYALMKLRTANTHELLRECKRRLGTEKIALSALSGLAVPELVELNYSDYVEVPRFGESISMSWSPWKNAYKRAMTLDQTLGLWLFTIEQITAFRRRQIIYTDLKPHHILVRKDFKRAVLVDFDAATVVDESDIYHKQHLALTFAYMPPEAVFAKELSEAAFVYGTGMLFWSFIWSAFTNNTFKDSVYLQYRKKLKTKGLSSLVSLLNRILSNDPAKRPKNYEVVYAEALQAIRRPKALEVWRELRKPYLGALQELGFNV